MTPSIILGHSNYSRIPPTRFTGYANGLLGWS